MSLTPNDEYIEPMIFRQWEGIAEFEARHDLLFGQPGKVKFLAYANTGFMGKYDEAVYAGFVTGTTPDTSQDRKKRTNVGGGINVEQPVSDDLGFFLRWVQHRIDPAPDRGFPLLHPVRGPQ